MNLRRKGRAAFLVLVCFVLGGAGAPGSDIDRLVAPGGRTTLRGSLFSPGFSIRHSAPDSVVITLSLGELTVQPRTTRRGLEHHVFLDDGERWERIGAPDLPVYRKLVAVPDGGEVRVTARPRARRLISGVTVLPFEPAVGRVGARADVRGDGIAPRQWVAVEHVGYLRAQRIVSLLIAPARYLPGRRELDVATDLEVVVTVEGSAGDVLKNVGPLQGVLKGTVLNAGAGLSATPNPVSGPGLGAMSAGGQICWCSGSNWQDAAASAISCSADYLMIVSDSLVASTMVDTLALWRAEYNGFNVAIVKMSQIDVEPDTASTPVSIRALIDSVYTSESAMHMGDGHLGYVLLVGDAYDANRKELVPSYYGYADTTVAKKEELRRASDAYYSFLDDDPITDRFPDVMIGRLPVDRDDADWEITNLVRKIVSYEPLSGEAWADSILLVSGRNPSGFTFPAQLSGFKSFFDSVLTYYTPAGKVATQQHRLAMTGSASDTTKHRIFGNKIRASMARGKWITTFFDHGFLFYWDGAFYPRSYEFIADTGKPSIVFSIGSHTTQFDLTADWALNVMGSCPDVGGCTVEAPSSLQCESPGHGIVDPCDVIAERLLVQEGGAVAVIGYSRSQDTFSAQADFTNLFRSLSDQNPTTLGELLVGARMFRISNEITARNLMLLGDPALDIRTRAPAAEDTVDVAVGVHDIRLVGEADGEMIYYVNSNNTLALSARIRNPWRIDAADVDVEFWQDEPGAQGSTLLGSTTLDLVPAYDSVLVNFNVGDPGGNFEVFVVIDPDDEIVERNEDNNVASRAFLGLPYKGDYPVRLGMNPSRPIVVADIASDMGKEFLVSGLLEVRCYAASDTSELWSHQIDLVENEILKSTPVVGHLFKSSARYVAIETIAPSMSSLLRIVSGESGATIGVDTLSQNVGTGGDLGLAKWMLTDLGPDDSTMELVGLVYRLGGVIGETLVQAYSPSDSLLSSLLVEEAGGTPSAATMAIADLDANGSKELIILIKAAASTKDLKVYRYGSGGFSLMWELDVAAGVQHQEPTIVLIDHDGDGDVEILCSGTVGTDSAVRLLNASGSSVWGASVTANAPPRFAAGDLNGDGQAEIVVADSGRLRVLSSASGQVLNSLTSLPGTPVSGPYLVDLDANGMQDIVVLYETENDYFFPSRFHTYLYVLDGGLDELEPLRVFSPQTATSVHSIVAPAIDDLDGDGQYEMMYVSTDNVLHVFELGSAAGEAAWSQRFANALNTGLNEQPVIGDAYVNPVSLYQKTRMLGHVTLDSIAAPSLYIGHGTEMRVDASVSDPFQFHAFGSVRMKGSAAAPVVIHSDPPASGAAAWGGLYIHDRFSSAADPDSLSFVQLSDASIGVEVHSPLHVSFSTISNVATAGVVAGDTLWFDRSSVSNSSGLGVKLLSGAVGRIRRSVVSGTDSTAVLCDSCAYQTTVDSTSVRSAGGDGLRIIGSTAWQGTPGIAIDSCTVEDNAGAGIRFEGAHGTVSRCRVEGNAVGVIAADASNTSIIENTVISGGAVGVEHASAVRITGSRINDVSSVAVVSSDTLWFESSEVDGSSGQGVYLGSGALGRISDSSIAGTDFSAIVCDTCGTGTSIRRTTIDSAGLHGIHVVMSSDVLIDSCVVVNSASAGTRFEWAGGIVSKTRLDGNGGGVVCFESSSPVIRECSMDGNTGGVAAVYDSYPVVGYGTSGGLNCITNTTGYNVSNLNSPGTVFARHDHWGAVCCKPSKFFGNVSCDSCVKYSACDAAAAPGSFAMAADEGESGVDSLSVRDEATPALPKALDLVSAAPNPFNPSVRIRYAVPAGGAHVRLTVYNVRGHRVAILEDGPLPAGYHEAIWHGRTSRGSPAASGVYLVQMSSGGFRKTMRVVLLK